MSSDMDRESACARSSVHGGVRWMNATHLFACPRAAGPARHQEIVLRAAGHDLIACPAKKSGGLGGIKHPPALDIPGAHQQNATRMGRDGREYRRLHKQGERTRRWRRHGLRVQTMRCGKNSWHKPTTPQRRLSQMRERKRESMVET